MKLTKENKEHIDSLTYYDLLAKWRFAPIGDSWLQGETREYWMVRLQQKRDEDINEAIRDSKVLGWREEG